MLKRKGRLWYFDTSPERPPTPRPHLLAILIGVLPAIISSVALIISLQSLKVSQDALKIGQRAYLTVAKVEVEKTSSDIRIRTYVNNLGNTPAFLRLGAVELRAARTADAAAALGGSKMTNARFIHPLPVISPGVDIGPKNSTVLEVGCNEVFFSGLHGEIWVAGYFNYYDVFNQRHRLTWGWRMTDFKIMNALHPMQTAGILFFSGLIKDLPEIENTDVPYDNPFVTSHMH